MLGDVFLPLVPSVICSWSFDSQWLLFEVRYNKNSPLQV